MGGVTTEGSNGNRAGGRGILNEVLRASTWEAGPECRVRAQMQQGGRPLDGQHGAEEKSPVRVRMVSCREGLSKRA